MHSDHLSLNSSISSFARLIRNNTPINQNTLKLFLKVYEGLSCSPKLDVTSRDKLTVEEVKDVIFSTGYFALKISNFLITKPGGYSENNLKVNFNVISNMCSSIFAKDDYDEVSYLTQAIATYLSARENYRNGDTSNSDLNNLIGTLILFAIGHSVSPNQEEELKIKDIKDISQLDTESLITNFRIVYSILKKDVESLLDFFHISYKASI